MRRLAQGLAVLVTALLSTALLPPATRAADCTAGYPRPRVSLSGERTKAMPAESPRLAFGGYLLHGTCPLAGRTVGLFTQTTGGYTYATKVVTGPNGQFGAKVRFAAEMDVLAIFSGDATEGRAVSQVWHVYVGRQGFDFPFGGQCSYSRLDGPRYAPPDGVIATTLDAPVQITIAADHFDFRVRVVNDSHADFTFTPEYNQWFGNPAVLENIATGEQVSYTVSSDAIVTEQPVTLTPGQSLILDRRANLRPCQSSYQSHKALTPGHFRLHGAVLLHSDDVPRTRDWFAPAVDVTLRG